LKQAPRKKNRNVVIAMIDTKTGAIRFTDPRVVVTSDYTASVFQRSPLAKLGGALPGVRFGFQPVTFMGEPFSGSLRFEGGVLRSVQLVALRPEFGTSWAEFSEEKELARKALHETLLQQALGGGDLDVLVRVELVTDERLLMRGREFAWGVARSFYDNKAGFSAIELEYTVEM
jgi:hypothetical protein